jgi:lipopolysaccharide export system protein LptA
MMKTMYVFFVLFLMSTTAVFAQDMSNYDTNKPIQIDANSLEVLQNDKKAIFSGNVVTTQGDVRLKADSMTVYYKQGETKSATPDNSKISKIEVNGNVFLATPKDSAKGEKGVYLVDQKVIRLTGGVVLTSGKNVLKGNGLEYNMATGKSVLAGGASATVEGKPATGGRVRALFVPEQSPK